MDLADFRSRLAFRGYNERLEIFSRGYTSQKQFTEESFSEFLLVFQWEGKSWAELSNTGGKYLKKKRKHLNTQADP